MTDYDTMRRDIAEAMGWTAVHLDHDGVIRGLHPDGTSRHRRDIPDPLRSADDAEDLEAWCVEQGWEVEARFNPDQYSVRIWRGLRCAGLAYAYAHDEPDPIMRRRLVLVRRRLVLVRRRLVLVRAAWDAVQATREVQP